MSGYPATDKEGNYRLGAFSCWVCQRQFNHEVALMGKDAATLHEQAHMARFLNYVFSKEEIRHAFYEYIRREKTMADLNSLNR